MGISYLVGLISGIALYGLIKGGDENEKLEIIDTREKPLEFQMTDLLKETGIFTIEQLKELLEPNYFAIIPIDILEKRTISSNAKLLYAEVLALSRKSGK